MFYVYLIQSKNFPKQRYIGYSSDLKQRIEHHNSGKSLHTKKYMPWILISYLGFSDEQSAKDFEKYLKSGSGQALASKRLWNN